MVNNIRPPQTPTVVHNNNQVEGTVTANHQNSPTTALPLEEQLPSGYVEITFVSIFILLI